MGSTEQLTQWGSTQGGGTYTLQAVLSLLGTKPIAHILQNYVVLIKLQFEQFAIVQIPHPILILELTCKA